MKLTRGHNGACVDSTHLTLVGCSGWTEAKPKYFADFASIELQSTFYEPPSVALARKWRALAPDSFHFCLKAWQLITHTASSPTYRKMKSKLSPSELNSVGSFRSTEQVDLAWDRTSAIARALRARVILFQCPASFRPESQNIENLACFFSRISREDFELAWEPRGDWRLPLVHALCSDLDLLHCVDPFDSVDAALEAPYWRLHGREGYSYRYSDDDLQYLLHILQKPTAKFDRTRYLFFINIFTKDDALRLRVDKIAEASSNTGAVPVPSYRRHRFPPEILRTLFGLPNYGWYPVSPEPDLASLRMKAGPLLDEANRHLARALALNGEQTAAPYLIEEVTAMRAYLTDPEKAAEILRDELEETFRPPFSGRDNGKPRGAGIRASSSSATIAFQLSPEGIAEDRERPFRRTHGEFQ